MAVRKPHKKENEQNPEDYFFMKETIKKKPLNLGFYVKRAAAVIMCGALFGCSAAAAFTLAYPAASGKFLAREDVSLSGVRPGPVGAGSSDGNGTGEEAVANRVTDAPQETDEQENGNEAGTAVDALEDTRGNWVEEVSSPMEIYESVYQDALQISEQPMKAMVRVSGISADADLLDDSFLTYGDEEGVVFLNSGTDLYILTNYKGVEASDVIRVTFCNGTAADAILCGADTRTGMAVVRVPLTFLTDQDCDEIYVASLSNTYSLNNEKPVIAIGSPSGDFSSVIYGLITSTSGKMTVADCEYTLLGTNIMGSTESSGVLLNMDGEVVGIIVRTREDENILKAVSIAQLRPLIESLSNEEPIRYFGIRGSSISIQQARNMDIPQGIYVNGVETDSPAMIAGIQSGDIITGLNGKDVKDMQSYMTELQKLAVGSRQKLTVCRKGAEGKFVEIEYILTVEEK